MFNKEKPVEIIVDRAKCALCGICIEACSGEYLTMTDLGVEPAGDSPFGCIQCGRCMISCPVSCISVRGEGISEKDLVTLNQDLPNYDKIYSLLLQRRSTRKFKNLPLSKEIIDKVLDAASTAPISIPPSEVKVMVINGFDKVQEFAGDVVHSFEKALRIMNPVALSLLKPVIGDTTLKIFKEFIIPLGKMTIEARNEGKDILFYNAPAVVVFYSSEFGGNEDALIAAQTGMIAAESLGLGTCIIGTIPPILERSKKLKEKFGFLKNEKVALAFILGYPETKLKKGIKRRFKEVRYL